jgi:hypothetical protein
MNTIIPLLNPAAIADETELAEHQLAALDLSKLPRKVRVCVRRPNALIQIKHVGEKLFVQHIASYNFGSVEHEEECSAVADKALSEAVWLLDCQRHDNRLYRSATKGLIEIVIDQKSTGAQALAALDAAVEALVTRASQLIAVVAKGIQFKHWEDTGDW